MFRVLTATVAVLLGAVLLALVFTLGYVSNGEDSTSGGGNRGQETQRDIDEPREGDVGQTLNDILDILESEYVDTDELDQDALYEAAINGLVDSLADTGTFYIDPISYQTSIGPSGSFEGIGATVQPVGNDVVIVRPIEGSPAEAAGVQSGDVILAVDGESTQGWTVDRAVLRIRGPKGTDVTITIRHVDGVTEDITITRAEIQINSVSTTPPGGVLRDASGKDVTDVAYMRISEFVERTPDEVAEVASEAEESGKSGLIIDLRGNPGGLLIQTVDVADLFLDGGKTILVEVNREDEERTFRSRDGGAAVSIPIVILQDQFSASGAEVLAAALRDNGRATIIGTVSFGKGTVNISRGLDDGGALFVTIARWLTPDGVLIDGVGIVPDVEIEPGPFDPQYDPTQDVQIQKAIEELRALKASEELAPASAGP